MRTTVIGLCATLAMGAAMATELVSHQDGNTIRFGEAACSNESVLNRLPPELRAQFRAASAVLDGQNFQACWRVTPAGAYLIYEDGDQGLVPFGSLRPLISV